MNTKMLKYAGVMFGLTLVAMVVSTVFEIRGNLEFADYAQLTLTIFGLGALALFGLACLPLVRSFLNDFSFDELTGKEEPKVVAADQIVLKRDEAVIAQHADKLQTAIQAIGEDERQAKRIVQDLEVYATTLAGVVVGLAKKIDEMNSQMSLLLKLSRELDKPEPNTKYLVYLAGTLASARLQMLAGAQVKDEHFWDGVRKHVASYMGNSHAQIAAYRSLGAGTLEKLNLLERGIAETERLFQGARISQPLLRASKALMSGGERLTGALAPNAVSLVTGNTNGGLMLEPLVNISVEELPLLEA